jgi:pimeloyl-ACP methyl ester carboxylesterase
VRLAVPGVSGFHELHACDWGKRRARRVLVCSHGYSGNARDFDFLARALAGDMRVVCPDMPGRGESGWLPSPLHYHFGQFLADMRMLLARLGVAEVDWVGTSMGGLIGMLLASQPSSPIRRLVMNDVGAFLPTDALQYIGRNLDAPAVFATLADVEAHMRHTHREWGEIGDEQWRQLAVHGSRRTEGGWRLHYDPQIAQVVRPMPLMPGLYFWDAWYRVRCPVLLVRGEHSHVFPPEVAQAMIDIKPGTELVEVAGCGHVPALMSDDQVRIVREFLEQPAPAPERRSMPAVSPRTSAP